MMKWDRGRLTPQHTPSLPGNFAFKQEGLFLWGQVDVMGSNLIHKERCLLHQSTQSVRKGKVLVVDSLPFFAPTLCDCTGYQRCIFILRLLFLVSAAFKAACNILLLFVFSSFPGSWSTLSHMDHVKWKRQRHPLHATLSMLLSPLHRPQTPDFFENHPQNHVPLPFASQNLFTFFTPTYQEVSLFLSARWSPASPLRLMCLCVWGDQCQETLFYRTKSLFVCCFYWILI